MPESQPLKTFGLFWFLKELANSQSHDNNLGKTMQNQVFINYPGRLFLSVVTTMYILYIGLWRIYWTTDVLSIFTDA